MIEMKKYNQQNPGSVLFTYLICAWIEVELAIYMYNSDRRMYMLKNTIIIEYNLKNSFGMRSSKPISVRNCKSNYKLRPSCYISLAFYILCEAYTLCR